MTQNLNHWCDAFKEFISQNYLETKHPSPALNTESSNSPPMKDSNTAEMITASSIIGNPLQNEKTLFQYFKLHNIFYQTSVVGSNLYHFTQNES